MVEDRAYIRIGLLLALYQRTCLVWWFLVIMCYLVCVQLVMCMLFPPAVACPHTPIALCSWVVLVRLVIVCVCHVDFCLHGTLYPMTDCICMDYCVYNTA